MKNQPNPLLAFVLTLFALSALACGGGPAEESATGEPADGAESASEVEYEAAYPEEVSDEGLSEEDTRQQESHSHGDDGDHAHGDEGHMHDGDEGHMHDDDEGHMHDGDEGHMHDGDEDHMHDEHGDDDHQD